jgi:serine/threonine-protein kinase
MKVMRDLVGDLLSDRYRLVSRVAGGGMGEVYRAHDLLLDRTVAVKILQPTLATDPDLVHRFRAEARAVARLSHPNIVAVHDWGSEDDRTYYMVMEYVSGSDLRDVLVDNGALSPSQAVGIAASMCDALSEAHKTGIVHRDIKPENVLISKSGTVKVVDFGIAAVADAERTSPGNALSGTLRYLSPEQAAGDQATPFSDVWATGAVLAEMLTGRPPQGGGPEGLRRRMMEPPSPPSDVVLGLPSELDSIVMKACALDPPARFDGAGEMATALRRVLERSLPDSGPLSDLLFEATGEIRTADKQATSYGRTMERSKRLDRSRRLTLMKVGGVLVALILLIAGIAKAAGTFGGPSSIKVPVVRGKSKVVASNRLERAGLHMVVTSQAHSGSVPRGSVVLQSPHPGSLTGGSKVRVVLSSGPAPRAVPSLTGSDQAQAEVRLRASHLRLGWVQKRYSLMKPAGTVVSQQPSGGELVPGSKVGIVLSLGPRPVAVPEVTGSSKQEAAQKLKAAGLRASFTEDYSNSAAKGQIVSTTPGGGTTADEGSVVSVVVSKGPRWTVLKMPDVRGLPLDQAKAKLESLQLRPTVRNCGGGSTVVDTDPIAYSTIRQNAIVALFVCG